MKPYSYPALLEKLEAMYGITPETLHRLTGIPAPLVKGEQNPENERERQEQAFLFTALIFLTERLVTDEDAYLRGHMEKLMGEYGISPEAIALYSGMDGAAIAAFLQNGGGLSDKDKYRLAVQFFSMEYLFLSGRLPPLRSPPSGSGARGFAPRWKCPLK